MPDKPWYTSITLWGGLVMAIAFVISHFGFNLTVEEQTQIAQFLTTIATAVGGLVGLMMVVTGRKRTGDQIKTLKVALKNASLNPIAQKSISFPQSFIDLSNQLFGEGATTILSSGMFLTTTEGKKLIDAAKEAMASEKGKVLIEQFKKLGEGKLNVA